MTESHTGAGVSVSLAFLRLSAMPGQVERRKHFDNAGLEQLTETIRTVGILQPLLVRPLPIANRSSAEFEIVAGERRFIAAGRAGLAEVPVTIRELTDEQALEIQLIENLQREGLHEITEAEGYERLMKEHGYSIEAVVAKVGKSRAYVYARLKLLALCPIARQAFFRNVISASVALLIARVPDEGLQKKALNDVTKGGDYGKPMSVREAQDHLQEEYMLRLADAPFPTDDAQLVPAAGTCGDCPKRTGNQAELFKDVKGLDVCTDPPCFKRKREAFVARQLAKAKETGQKVIDGTAAKKLLPYGNSDSVAHSSGYVSLDNTCNDDSRYRTYRQILGKTAPLPTLVVAPKSRDVIEVVSLSQIKPLLKKAGVGQRQSPSASYAKEDRARRDKAKREAEFRLALFTAVRIKGAPKLGRTALVRLATTTFDMLRPDAAKAFYQSYGWDLPKQAYSFPDAGKRFAALDEAGLARAINALTYIDDVVVFAHSVGKPLQLLAAAKAAKIDAAKFRRDLDAAAKAKAAVKPAPAKSKKARAA